MERVNIVDQHTVYHEGTELLPLDEQPLQPLDEQPLQPLHEQPLHQVLPDGAAPVNDMPKDSVNTLRKEKFKDTPSTDPGL